MSGVSDIYQEVILDHNKKPRNYKVVKDANHYCHGVNPLCGDDYHVFVKTTPEGVIDDIGFQGEGCAISKASASMMTSNVKGKPISEATEAICHFIELITRDCLEEKKEAMGSLMAFEGVRKFPVRVKCAALAWRALEKALKNESIKDKPSENELMISTE